MKILFYNWDSFGQDDMIQSFTNFGIDVMLTSYRCNNYDFDENFERKLNDDIKKGCYDFVFSFNYFPVISRVCEQISPKMKYVSWVFDSPHLTLYSETTLNPCNYIFHFDKYECARLKEHGAKNIFYLPLAVNVGRLDKIVCSEEEEKFYSSDITFIGRIYDKKNLYDQINYLPDYLKGYLDGIMKAQKLVYGYNFLEELLTDSILDEIKKYVKFDLGRTYFANDAFVFSNLFLGQKVTNMERKEVLDMLSENLQVDLYSPIDDSILHKAHHRGCIDYDTNMPKAFRFSKVNLNISLRTIQSGVPLRVFDIMGSGGFLITNYQQDMYDLFEVGKDFVTYESLEDLREKVNYYLEHDEERIAISKRGYQKVKQFHTFDKRVEEMLKTIVIE